MLPSPPSSSPSPSSSLTQFVIPAFARHSGFSSSFQLLLVILAQPESPYFVFAFADH
jgi:hypothetical protein